MKLICVVETFKTCFLKSLEQCVGSEIEVWMTQATFINSHVIIGAEPRPDAITLKLLLNMEPNWLHFTSCRVVITHV